MADTVIERIAIEIIARLQTITIANGYPFDVTDVVRPDRLGTGFTPDNYLMLVTQKDSSYNSELSHEGNPPAIAFDTTFEIACMVRESDKDENAIATTTNAVIAAAMKAIVNGASDPGLWYQMAGNAIICNWGSISPFSQSEGNHAGGTLDLIVTHRQSENDPYTVRS